MNKQQAAAMLPIVQAMAEGKEIQYNPSGTSIWEDVDGVGVIVSWLERHPEKYRIKPEPRVFYGIRSDKGDVFAVKEVQKQRDDHYDKWPSHRRTNGWQKITLIEVL